MSNIPNASGMSPGVVDKAYDDAIEHVEHVADVKTDLSFVSIFANLIRKMDDTAQTAVS